MLTVRSPAWKAALACAAFALLFFCFLTERADICVANPLSFDEDLGYGHAHGRGAAKHKGDDEDADGDRPEIHAARVPVFGPHERDVISRYYHNLYAGLPPGLAKRGGQLPPGLERHLQRNGTLPPGLQKSLQPLPHDLARRLPRLPTPYARGIIGTDVILLDHRTSAILDIIRNAAILAGK